MEQKKKRIMVGCVIYQIDPVVYSGHLGLMYRLGKELQDYDVLFVGPWRNPIDKARNMIAELALVNECDYLFFYDDDMYFLDTMTPVKMLNKMVESNDRIHILQALAYIRGYPYEPMLFKKIEEDGVAKLSVFKDFAKHIEDDGLVKCDAVGCCATLIDCKLLKMMPKPYFLTGEKNTEDIYFCIKAADYICNVGIYCDTTLEVGHLLDRPVLTSYSSEIIREMHERHDANQLWMPDPSFVPNIQGQKAPFKFVDCKNPLEEEENVLRETASVCKA